ncbi:MAG: RecQ family ATP-dependent DNA helicase [Candidatus Delongbacteria bacterium]|nr:RecQ family ATP-dependent DNA helicase [Candidatus Delongbacteria bacterium]
MRKLLQKYFGFADFHPLQKEIIEDILNNNDALVLMPTGGGKSLCYQLPAIIKDGLTIVISPLISLMKDQVDYLQSIGISAVSINSGMDYDDIDKIRTQLTNKEIKLLYVAPERIMTQKFLNFLHQLEISLIAIDEAHCISEWGHDFRPEYSKLNQLKEHFPNAPLIALTSTAIPQVQDDIIRQLNMENSKLYKTSVNRKNLFYQVMPKKKTYQHILHYVKNHANDSGIIYCQSRKNVEKIADKLQKDGIRALPYHAGLPSEVRIENQRKFIKDNVEIIVATIAFGMGIDKPNVRFVIHHDLPKSIEAYYQETGRAGRDGLESECILFFSYGDKIVHDFFIKKIEDDKYRQIATRKLRDVINFSTRNICRRKYLLNYFGEEYNVDNCNKCDICVPVEEIELVSYSKDRVRKPKVKKSANIQNLEYDEKLFEVLRSLRKKIADEEKKPPYIVFSDVSLKDMAALHPQNLDDFLNISGVGEFKLKKYGKIFTDKIVEYFKGI